MLEKYYLSDLTGHVDMTDQSRIHIINDKLT